MNPEPNDAPAPKNPTHDLARFAARAAPADAPRDGGPEASAATDAPRRNGADGMPSNGHGQFDLFLETAAPKKLHPDPHEWVKAVPVQTTAQVKVPERLIDQVIGQDAAVAVAHKAAEQKRNLLLIGDPGTGKSMIAKAMSEMLPRERLPDVVVYHNKQDPNNPLAKSVPGGQGKPLVSKYARRARRAATLWTILEVGLSLGLVGFGVWLSFLKDPPESILAFLFILLLAMLFLYFAHQRRPKRDLIVPKLLVENGEEARMAPYVDATGSQAGALLGDVRHDPFQSGGLETPAHLRVEAGAIHRANKGVLFIDEINVLRLASQQALLTAMQERQYGISGQSQSSSGSTVRTAPVACDFILVAAGNQDTLDPPDGLDRGLHPALRSRIRGYGYEVFVNSVMEDSHENRLRLVQFVAQEVARDGRIPHFDRAAVAEVIREAQRRSGRTGQLSLRLRELGGLVRTAGDYANTAGATVVTAHHVRDAKRAARSLEQQMTESRILNQLADQEFAFDSSAVGTAFGVGVIGTGEVGEPAGIVVPVEAAVVPAHSRTGGAIVLGQELANRRGHGVDNVGALLKTVKGAAIADHDVHIDAYIKHPDAEVEGIALAAAASAVSALESVPVRQDTVLIGNLAMSGRLRPVRATLQRIEAAANVGFRRAVVPAVLKGELVLEAETLRRIEVVYCETLSDALKTVIDGTDDLYVRMGERARPRRSSPAA